MQMNNNVCTHDRESDACAITLNDLLYSENSCNNSGDYSSPHSSYYLYFVLI